MECWKNQEIDLTEFFSPEYLDTSPDIEVRISRDAEVQYVKQETKKNNNKKNNMHYA